MPSVCDWWFNVDCSKAVTLYPLNKELMKRRAPEGIFCHPNFVFQLKLVYH